MAPHGPPSSVSVSYSHPPKWNNNLTYSIKNFSSLCPDFRHSFLEGQIPAFCTALPPHWCQLSMKASHQRPHKSHPKFIHLPEQKLLSGQGVMCSPVDLIELGAEVTAEFSSTAVVSYISVSCSLHSTSDL